MKITCQLFDGVVRLQYFLWWDVERHFYLYCVSIWNSKTYFTKVSQIVFTLILILFEEFRNRERFIMQTKAIFLALLLTAFEASAVCYNEDLIGYWDYYDDSEVLGAALNCSLRIGSNGALSLHRFGCEVYGVTGSITQVSGNVKIDSFCHITGQMVVEGVEGMVPKATLNRARDTIVGVLVIDGVADTFHMTKFY